MLLSAPLRVCARVFAFRVQIWVATHPTAAVDTLLISGMDSGGGVGSQIWSFNVQVRPQALLHHAVVCLHEAAAHSLHRSPQTLTWTVVAGNATATGTRDGVGTNALFSSAPYAAVMHPDGSKLFFSDTQAVGRPGVVPRARMRRVRAQGLLLCPCRT